MKLAVTPLLIAIGVLLLWHVIIADQTNFDACIYEDSSAAFARLAYWNNLFSSFSHPWAVVETAILACAFLPFIIAAFFVREKHRLWTQWGGLTIVILGCAVFFGLAGPTEPGWCFQTELFDRPHVFLAGLVLVWLTCPVFIVVTLMGRSAASKGQS